MGRKYVGRGGEGAGRVCHITIFQGSVGGAKDNYDSYMIVSYHVVRLTYTYDT